MFTKLMYVGVANYDGENYKKLNSCTETRMRNLGACFDYPPRCGNPPQNEHSIMRNEPNHASRKWPNHTNLVPCKGVPQQN
ncbi:hypothetical protein PBNK5_29030 [Pectobacterium brasiliense]